MVYGNFISCFSWYYVIKVRFPSGIHVNNKQTRKLDILLYLINYKIMYNQFTFSIYHNLYSVWCILLYWWCFLTINTFKTIMIVYFIMSVYYFIYSVDTLIHAYMVTDLSSLDISAKHCIIHNGYCYNNPSHGFHTN